MPAWWRHRWGPWAVLGGALLSAVPLAFVLRAAAPEEGDPVNCGGIGWGETPCGWDAVHLTYLFVGIPFLVVVVSVLLVLEMVGSRAHSARLAVAALALALPWVLALADLAFGP